MVEVTQSHIVNEGSFSITPTSVVEVGGKTKITWSNIAQHVGNFDNRLAADETFTVTFTAASTMYGSNIPVNVIGQSVVNYLDPDDNPQTVNLPQAYLNVRTPPFAEAGSYDPVEQTSHDGAYVTLDGSDSYDKDNYPSPLIYVWTWAGGSAIGVNPTIQFPYGSTEVTLTVFDGDRSATDTATITVVDTTKPEITIADGVHVLWPPNHKYHTFTLADFGVSASDICDPNIGPEDLVITSVTSDEAENEKGKGDGNTWDDIVIMGSQQLKLRAERQGTGDGRVYTIHFEVTDHVGNTETGFVQVWVPHDQKTASAVVDSGVHYIVFP
ncbi:MAG: hypothetical protein ACE5OZ_24480 [Candidatus Heimdallarchaeota archaeon]